MTGTVDYPVMGDGEWVTVPVPAMDGEPVVVPNIGAIIFPDEGRAALLLQRRDKAGEPTRGLLEIPMGRWRAGEDPLDALRREVAEETGLELTGAMMDRVRHHAHPGRPFVAARPIAVANGVDGAYPALVVAFECVAGGTPRPEPGFTAEPAWYPIAEVRRMLQEPAQFTGVTFALLATWMEVRD